MNTRNPRLRCRFRAPNTLRWILRTKLVLPGCLTHRHCQLRNDIRGKNQRPPTARKPRAVGHPEIQNRSQAAAPGRSPKGLTLEQFFVLRGEGIRAGSHRSHALRQALRTKSKSPPFKKRRTGHPKFNFKGRATRQVPLSKPIEHCQQIALFRWGMTVKFIAVCGADRAPA
jgi:hypothetical protein